MNYLTNCPIVDDNEKTLPLQTRDRLKTIIQLLNEMVGEGR